MLDVTSLWNNFDVWAGLTVDDICLQNNPSCLRETATKMLALMNKILDWFRSLFWKEEMELTLVGLQYSGKTTFVNVIAVRFPSPFCLTMF